MRNRFRRIMQAAKVERTLLLLSSHPFEMAFMSEARAATYRIAEQPYYRPVDDEVELYRSAYAARLPVMLKGPTGCGKSRFVEYMAHTLDRPLVTVACNEDSTRCHDSIKARIRCPLASKVIMVTMSSCSPRSRRARS